MLAILSKSGQSSYSAMIGIVACLFLLFVGISRVYGISLLTRDAYLRSEMKATAILISNDLLLSPGYGRESIDWDCEDFEHVGLAKYDEREERVKEHELDRKKIERLKKILKSSKQKLKDDWNIDYDFGIVIKKVGGEELINYRPSGNFSNIITISRLGTVENEKVLLEFSLLE